MLHHLAGTTIQVANLVNYGGWQKYSHRRDKTWPEPINLFSCSTQLCMKTLTVNKKSDDVTILLINVKVQLLLAF